MNKKYDPDAVDRWIDMHASADKDIRLRTAMERSDKASAGIKRSETMKERWQDPDYQNKVLSGLHAAKNRLSEASKNLWKDPDYRNKNSRARIRRCKTPLGEFSSLEEATKAHGKKPCNRWIRSQIAKKVPGFEYLD